MAKKKSPPSNKAIAFAIDPGFLESHDTFEVIEPVLMSVRTDTLAHYDADLARWSRPQRLLLAMHLYIAEVNNGGHDQFFWNSSGLAWSDAAEGFRAAGCPRIAGLIDEAVQRLGGAPSADQTKRNEAMEASEPDFGDLDDAFYDFDDDDAVEDALKTWVLAQPDAFVFTGAITPVG